MFPLTESLFGVLLSVLIIVYLIFFGKNLPSIEPYRIYIILFFAVCIFINFNYSFGIHEQYENKNN